MTRLLFLALMCSAPAAHAACYADYKAKKDDPLQLHYGVAEITGGCDTASAEAELAPRIDAAGWHLLSVVSTFDDSGLDERKARAGDFYLRF